MTDNVGLSLEVYVRVYLTMWHKMSVSPGDLTTTDPTATTTHTLFLSEQKVMVWRNWNMLNLIVSGDFFVHTGPQHNPFVFLFYYS
jgi:hypothetical protein